MSEPITNDSRINEILRLGREGAPMARTDWEEVATWLEENLISDERIQREYKSGVTTGNQNERDRIVKAINEKAAAAFIARSDDEAKSLRDLATWVTTLAR